MAHRVAVRLALLRVDVPPIALALRASNYITHYGEYIP